MMMCKVCEDKYSEPGLALEYGARLMPLMPTPRQVNALMDAINNRRPGDDDATALTRALHAAINAAPRLETPNAEITGAPLLARPR